ncbi:histone-like nucleoid-structuring protein, MvaT/MvaU family [Pseudomonas sp. ML2-2023-3]|uniref:histone-like nucleoid-structuring protein, MvaT/MvaU family n=1 Tax=Pseudomonas sp. ML2-2023-3 TaxID=3122375 RepID=UPI0030CCC96F
MSKVARYRDLERQIIEQQRVLEALKNDKSFQVEAEFEHKLRTLMEAYGVNLHQIVALLEPVDARATDNGAGVTKAPRTPRVLKRYLNPHTHQVVETKGGNHKMLQAWKKEHGPDQVGSWLLT